MAVCLTGGCPENCNCAVCSNTSGNFVSQIPVKVGEPLSTACERTVTEGSIPQVIRFPNWTWVNGGTVVNQVSMGGICNISSFFKSRAGCYYNTHARLSGATCC